MPLMPYPITPEENLRYRIDLDQQAMQSEEVRAFIIAACREDILTFFNVALWTHDPRSEYKYIPFITYQYQDEWLLWASKAYRDQKDFLTDKSRDMGVSWMMAGLILWLWLFEPGFSVLIGSYIEDYIDNKTLDCHFGRLRYMISKLPPWLFKSNDAMKISNYMKIENEHNSNMIIGYAPTANFSRQGRYSMIWCDEFAFWQHGRSAWIAMGDATRCRAVTSTPNGKGNKFADLALKSQILKKSLHWSVHPLKTQLWYETECLRRTTEEIAQELDISYNKSVVGRVYPEFCERNYMEFQPYNPTQPLYCAWDFGLDTTAIIWLQVDKTDNTIRIIDSYQNVNKAIDFYVPFITGEVKSIVGIPGYEYTTNELNKIVKHKTWQPAIHYGDPTGSANDRARGTSYFGDLRKYGIVINCNRAEFDLKTRIHKTKLLIRRLVVDKDQNEFIDAMEQCRYPDRGESSQATSPVDKPIHDWTSHFRTTLEYYAVNENIRGEKKSTIAFDNFDTRALRYKQEKKKTINPSYKPAC